MNPQNMNTDTAAATRNATITSENGKDGSAIFVADWLAGGMLGGVIIRRTDPKMAEPKSKVNERENSTRLLKSSLDLFLRAFLS